MLALEEFCKLKGGQNLENSLFVHEIPIARRCCQKFSIVKNFHQKCLQTKDLGPHIPLFPLEAFKGTTGALKISPHHRALNSDLPNLFQMHQYYATCNIGVFHLCVDSSFLSACHFLFFTVKDFFIFFVQ